jgi:DNA mismatch endonuclease, patch repair protein
MSQIRGSDTKPEIAVRSYLHGNGLRFRIHDKKLPGKPDLALKKYNTAIFIDGCFWHRHKGCKYSYTPKSRVKFWRTKFENNIKRDNEVNGLLKDLSWNVIRIWECEISESVLDSIILNLRKRLN